MDDLRERVEAVERAVTDGEGELTALADGAARAERVAALEDDLEALQADLAEVEAATQALRGYVGNVRSANESVEARADSAVAAVEALEERVDALETAPSSREPAAEAETDVAVPDERAPTGGDTGTPQPPEGDQGVGARNPAVSSGTEPGETGTSHQEPCHVCGRGAGTEPAADGGARSAEQIDRTGPHQRGNDTGIPAGKASTDRSIGGVDPTDESHRVRIDHDGQTHEEGTLENPAVTSAGATGARDGPSPGVLDRLRELL